MRCNCFNPSDNSELQFIKRGHKGLVNNVLDVSTQEEIKRCKNFLTCIFLGAGLGFGRPIPWPLRLPDLTPLDFFLREYVKNIVYKTPVTSLDELKFRIVAAIKTPQMLENTWKEITYRLNILRAAKGTRIEVVSVLRY